LNAENRELNRANEILLAAWTFLRAGVRPAPTVAPVGRLRPASRWWRVDRPQRPAPRAGRAAAGCRGTRVSEPRCCGDREAHPVPTLGFESGNPDSAAVDRSGGKGSALRSRASGLRARCVPVARCAHEPTGVRCGHSHKVSDLRRGDPHWWRSPNRAFLAVWVRGSSPLSSTKGRLECQGRTGVQQRARLTRSRHYRPNLASSSARRVARRVPALRAGRGNYHPGCVVTS
jgi:hypothetical protein